MGDNVNDHHLDDDDHEDIINRDRDLGGNVTVFYLRLPSFTHFGIVEGRNGDMTRLPGQEAAEDHE